MDPSERTTRGIIDEIYNGLFGAAGPRHWWPGDGRDEIIIGAVLTQNTAWKNVELALANLRAAGLMRLALLAVAPPETIAPLIRPAGYFNLKSKRLRSVAEFFAPGGVERFDALEAELTDALREAVLGVWGVGPETADSILLYALGRLTFVVDAYTIRVMSRHGLIPADAAYEEVRDLLARNTPAEVRVFNEFHALFVWVGHHFCKPKPLCGSCPLFKRGCFASREAFDHMREVMKPETYKPKRG